MDFDRAMLVVDQLFSEGATEVGRDEVKAAADRATIDADTRTDFHSLVRERYTRDQLVDELRSMGRNAPIGGAAGFGGAG